MTVKNTTWALADILSTTNIVTTLFVAIVTLLLTLYLSRKSLRKEELTYRMHMLPLFDNKQFKEFDQLQITYKGEQIDQLVLLELDIINTGNVAIKLPPIRVTSVDPTYIIPAYIDDVPPGYDSLWRIERTDADECGIVAEHINPGQIIKARFLMDVIPKGEPVFSCPVADLKIRRMADVTAPPFAFRILEMFYPSVARMVSAIK